jgi:uncharacterized protein
MVNLFCDTSALVKNFLIEEHSPLMREQYAGAEHILVSQITWVEMNSAFARRLLLGESTSEAIQKAMEAFRVEWKSFAVLPTDAVVVEYAGGLCRSLNLRAYDAVQLAAARLAERDLGKAITFASFDHKLIKAAQTLGLQTL